MMSTIDLTPDWTQWRVSTPVELMRPEMDYECANLAVEPSAVGDVEVRCARFATRECSRSRAARLIFSRPAASRGWARRRSRACRSHRGGGFRRRNGPVIRWSSIGSACAATSGWL